MTPGSSKYMDDRNTASALTWYRGSGIDGGGMSYLVLRAFIESVRDRKAPPLDAYDGAA